MHVLIMKTRGIFKIYQQALVRRPYLIQAVQTGALMGAGDLISQTIIEKKTLKHVDYMRTIKFSSIGFFVGVSRSLYLYMYAQKAVVTPWFDILTQAEHRGFEPGSRFVFFRIYMRYSIRNLQ